MCICDIWPRAWRVYITPAGNGWLLISARGPWRQVYIEMLTTASYLVLLLLWNAFIHFPFWHRYTPQLWHPPDVCDCLTRLGGDSQLTISANGCRILLGIHSSGCSLHQMQYPRFLYAFQRCSGILIIYLIEKHRQADLIS
jgi:hypothetical protein